MGPECVGAYQSTPWQTGTTDVLLCELYRSPSKASIDVQPPSCNQGTKLRMTAVCNLRKRGAACRTAYGTAGWQERVLHVTPANCHDHC